MKITPIQPIPDTAIWLRKKPKEQTERHRDIIELMNNVNQVGELYV